MERAQQLLTETFGFDQFLPGKQESSNICSPGVRPWRFFLQVEGNRSATNCQHLPSMA